MFQSSSTASGISARHASSACKPSSASPILKFIPSRIRRATFLMTLESSTTKQVFIAASLFPALRPPLSLVSCRHRAGLEVEHTLDVEDHQQLAIQSVYAGRHACQPLVQVDGIALAGVVRKLQNFAHAIDEQTV